MPAGNRLFDMRNREELFDSLSQILIFVELFNVRSSLWIARNARSRVPISLGPSLPVRGVLLLPTFKELLREVGSEVLGKEPIESNDGARILGSSDLATRAILGGVNPRIKPKLIEALIQVLLRPAHVSLGNDLKFRVSGDPSLQRLPPPQRLSENLHIYDVDGVYGFATRRISSPPVTSIKYRSLLFWQEALNPISTMRNFLIHALGEGKESADHYIQLWLRDTFDLPYEKHIKYALAAVCKRFNELFYGDDSLSHSVRSDKSSTLSTSLFLSEISSALGERTSSGGSLRGELRTLGIFLFLRFCRQLRCRYCWTEPGGDEVRREQDQKPLEVLHSLEGQHCVSALRSLEYTYFQTRIFGTISSISGFNFVFRGGLLPRAEAGQAFTITGPPGAGKTVLALQLMSDYARYGRLALYFSFEESYDAIVDRLITFGLYDSEKYEVLVIGRDDYRLRLSQGPRQNGRGLLLLYADAGPRSEAKDGAKDEAKDGEYFSLLDVVGDIARTAGAEWPWRALTIDSINALKFRSEAKNINRRFDLYELIKVMEDNSFFGIILSEKSDADFEVLSYLSDSVVELGFDQPALARWMEVKKCRNQDYQPGPHTFRILDTHGIDIYPSLTSRMSSLRRRVRSTLSERRFIPFPGGWQSALGLPGISEKSATLIYGASGTGKTLLLMHLATEPSIWGEPHERDGSGLVSSDSSFDAPSSVLLITFRTSELSLLQSLRGHEGLERRWSRIRRRRIRWYSPGDNLTGAEIIDDLWDYIQESRREGLPVERLVFDETESAEKFLPALHREPLFWSTVLELAATEAITSLFASGTETQRSGLVGTLRSSMDYILKTDVADGGKTWISAQKNPSWSKGRGGRAELRFNPTLGDIE